MVGRVLVTGISGFIAKHVARTLLENGFSVRGTIRSPGREGEVRAALAPYVKSPDQLSMVVADLDRRDGWEAASEGCRYVQHVASPFPLQQPREREALVASARDGALTVIAAAYKAGVERIVMTSSMVTMMYRANRPARLVVRESDWSDPEWPAATPYIISKTRAERAAWDFAEKNGLRERLVAINPGFVLGPALDGHVGTSLLALSMILRGAYPAVPPVSFPVVDVRDLAQVHVAAMTAPVGGRRLIATGETWTMARMAEELRVAHPDRARRIPTRQLPASLVRLLSAFDPSLRTLRADLGVHPEGDSAYVTDLTGVHFRPASEAVRDAGQSLIDFGLA